MMAVVIDTHCHLDVAAFADDRAAVLARAAAAGVVGMLIPAIRPATWAALTALPGQHPDAPLAVALGIHPQVVPELTADEDAIADALTEAIAAATTAQVVAIGECGLDRGTGARERQVAILRAHLRAARALGLPVILHLVGAHDIAPAILRAERVDQVGGVVHSFSGSPELVPIYAELNLALSFAGPVGWTGARKPKRAAAVVPALQLLAETDAPDQTPTSRRGGRNEPAFLPEVIEGLAAARGATPAAIAALTAGNARRWFPRAAAIWRSPPPAVAPDGPAG
jgi:TatD DNase family protein